MSLKQDREGGVEEASLLTFTLSDGQAKTRFVEAAGLETFTKNVHQDIVNLNYTVDKIRTGFTNVVVSLEEFDRREYKNNKGNVLELGPRWKDLRKRFNRLVSASRDQAAEAHAYLIRFHHVLLDPDNDTSTLRELRSEVIHFIKGLEVKNMEAQHTISSFLELSGDIDEFRSMVKDTAKHVGEPIVEELTTVDQEIEILRGHLSTLTETRGIEGEGLASSLPEAITAAGSAILTSSPSAMLRALRFVTKAADQKCIDMSGYQQEDILTKNMQETERIHRPIAVIGDIWQTFREVIIRMQTLLDSAGDSNQPANSFVRSYVSETLPVLDGLSMALDIYARNGMPEIEQNGENTPRGDEMSDTAASSGGRGHLATSILWSVFGLSIAILYACYIACITS